MTSSFLKPSLLSGASSGLARPKHTIAKEQALAFVSKLSARSFVSFTRGIVSMAAEGSEASASSDSKSQGEIAAPLLSSSKVTLPPRMCSLREFGEGMVAVDSDAKVSNFFELLAANIELSYKVQDWEILSGRLAMMVFASAVLIEAITGNSVFEKMDPQRVLEIFGAIFASVFVAAGFAIALQAKTRVAYTVSKGYENMMNSLIDNVFDSLLFDREDS
ncbi:hypothetical protein GOP47_0022281 [Adiantum capillus-veneris]|uniref:Uncharacterized protein n=1 Tax=Adiantum capillus-veneris TaxID=13818 RepID=A0A9D4UAQ8_ADICA|nr:hypothetical protein GOP47_0022281 [Adiantum capillus-veneris]